MSFCRENWKFFPLPLLSWDGWQQAVPPPAFLPVLPQMSLSAFAFLFTCVHACMCFSVCVCAPSHLHPAPLSDDTVLELDQNSHKLCHELSRLPLPLEEFISLDKFLSGFSGTAGDRPCTQQHLTPASCIRAGPSSELSHSQNKLIQRVEREVRSVIISGLWRGCCQAACTGGCPSCCLLPTRMQADRRQVYPPGAGWGPRMLIFCLCNRAGNIACCGAWETTSCLSPWTIGGNKMHLLGVQKTVAGRGSLLLQLMDCSSSELSYCALLDLHGLLCTCIFLSHIDKRLLLVVARCLLKLQGYWFSSLAFVGILHIYTHTIYMNIHRVSLRIFCSGWGKVRQNHRL